MFDHLQKIVCVFLQLWIDIVTSNNNKHFRQRFPRNNEIYWFEHLNIIKHNWIMQWGVLHKKNFIWHIRNNNEIVYHFIEMMYTRSYSKQCLSSTISRKSLFFRSIDIGRNFTCMIFTLKLMFTWTNYYLTLVRPTRW